MEMEVTICQMTPEDGAWEFAKELLAVEEISGNDKWLSVEVNCSDHYEDQEIWVYVMFGDRVVAGAHVHADMLLAAAKAIKAFKNAQLSKDE
jgi:hypothetical protein